MKRTGRGSLEHSSIFRVRLPGFLREDIGLGDVVKTIASAAGITPCAGCLRRAAILNRWLTFSGPARTSGVPGDQLPQRTSAKEIRR